MKVFLLYHNGVHSLCIICHITMKPVKILLQEYQEECALGANCCKNKPQGGEAAANEEEEGVIKLQRKMTEHSYNFF